MFGREHLPVVAYSASGSHVSPLRVTGTEKQTRAEPPVSGRRHSYRCGAWAELSEGQPTLYLKVEVVRVVTTSAGAMSSAARPFKVPARRCTTWVRGAAALKAPV